MTLQEKFTQEHVAKIRLDESAQIGEYGSSKRIKVKPGEYNVYKVTKKDEGYYGLMYAQKGDFYTNIEHMDMVSVKGVDAGTYGTLVTRTSIILVQKMFMLKMTEDIAQPHM